MSQSDFLAKLEAEAARQAKLSQKRVLPSQFDWFTSFVGQHPWQVVLVASALTAWLVTWGWR